MGPVERSYQLIDLALYYDPKEDAVQLVASREERVLTTQVLPYTAFLRVLNFALNFREQTETIHDALCQLDVSEAILDAESTIDREGKR